MVGGVHLRRRLHAGAREEWRRECRLWRTRSGGSAPSALAARAGTCYNDTGLFGVYFVANTEDKYKTHDLFHHVQEEMVALTTGVSDEAVVRA